MNIPNNINSRETIGMYNGDSIETEIRKVSIFSNNVEIKAED